MSDPSDHIFGMEASMSSSLLARRQTVRRRPPQSRAPGDSRETPVSLAVTVLMGGPSGERKVSLQSGAAVADALRKAGHDVTTADISPEDLSALDHQPLDVVFPALHGAFGEDGKLQEILEARGITYVGSDPAASALAMDKAAAKKRFEAEGLPTPPFTVFPHKPNTVALDHVLGQMGFPLVVKPVADGSSINVTIAHGPRELQAGMLACMMHAKAVLLEKYVRGREFTVGVLGDETLPVIELVVDDEHEFYDYDAKYDSDGTQYLKADGLSIETMIRIRALALAAHRALGCRDLSRVDIMLDERNMPWLLEVNTIPGFTSHSLVPKAAAHAGIDFPDFCDRLVRMALKRGRSL